MSARRPAGGGARRECRCARSRHVHGTVHAYRRDGCRCRACTAANTRAVTAYRMGRPVRSVGARMVDADPVRRLLRDLTREGWSLPQIARACGWASAASVERLLDARPGRAVSAVLPETAGRVRRGAAALRAGADPLRRGVMTVPVDATRRRVRALAAMGWSQRALADLSGVHRSTLAAVASGARTRVARQTERVERAARVESRAPVRLGPVPRRRSPFEASTAPVLRGYASDHGLPANPAAARYAAARRRRTTAAPTASSKGVFS